MNAGSSFGMGRGSSKVRTSLTFCALASFAAVARIASAFACGLFFVLFLRRHCASADLRARFHGSDELAGERFCLGIHKRLTRCLPNRVCTARANFAPKDSRSSSGACPALAIVALGRRSLWRS